MEFNFGNFTVTTGGIFTYPDFVPNATPKQPSQILETIFIEGTSLSNQLGMAGTADAPDSD